MYIVKWEEKPVIEQCAEYDLTFVYTQVYTHINRKWPVGMYITLLRVVIPREWECECGGDGGGPGTRKELDLDFKCFCLCVNEHILVL